MRILTLSIVLVAACGGGPLPLLSSVPAQHRATAAACSAPRPAINCSRGSSFAGSCSADSQCTAGSEGRCLSHNNALCTCTYDTCTSDADCGKGQLCGCHGTFGIADTEPNSCLPGNCRTDADCHGGYCSPSLDFTCGPYVGVTGFYCHTAQDTCVNDSDCKADGAAPGFCGYNPEIGHWACSYSFCAG